MDASGRQILFSLFALRLGVVSPDRIESALGAWIRDPERDLGEICLERGLIGAHQREVLQNMVDEFVRVHERLQADPEDGESTLGELPTLQLSRMEDRSAPSSSGPDPLEEVPLETPGNYQQQGVLGFGGQARVLLARDLFMERDVALKEMLRKVDPSDWETQEQSARLDRLWTLRFLREARITGRLEHPSIIPVYELRRREDGSLFYTMRRVSGTTLAQALTGCSNLSERMKLLGHALDLCQAVAFAHSRGVVHRDIKPENVMVGSFGETVLLDWGVAKARGQQEDPRGRELERSARLMHKAQVEHTVAGDALGTPAYMSPEQASGRVELVDELSDIWGLGAVLYNILTGQPPFTGERPLEVLTRVVEEPLRPVREVCPQAPRDLAAVAEKALHKEREERYQSAKDMAEDLSAYMTGDKVEAYAYSSWELLRRFARKNKIVLSLATALLVTVLVSLVVVSLSYRSESEARRLAESARLQEYRERQLANYHLAQAYANQAQRLLDNRLYLPGRIHAAASLLYNPATPSGPQYDPAFAGRVPASDMLRVEATSHLYRTDHRLVQGLLRAHRLDEAVSKAAFSPDGRLLATCDLSGHLTVWKTPDGSEVFRVAAHRERANALSFSPDGQRIATGGRDGHIRVFKPGLARPLLDIDRAGAPVESVAFSPDGQLLAAGDNHGRVLLFEAAGGVQVRSLEGHTDAVMGLSFSPGGGELATGSWDKTARVWDLQSGGCLQVLAGHTDSINRVTFSPDGARLATSSYDYTVRVWSVGDGRLLYSLEGHRDIVFESCFAPGGERIATASADGTVRIWDTGTRRLLETLHAHDDKVVSVAFSPDAGLLASGGHDRSVKLWRMRPVDDRILLEHDDWAYGVDFSSDGRLVATGSWDRKVRLWDARTGLLLRRMKVHPKGLFAVRFSPDNRLLASVDYGGTACLWAVDTGRRLRTLRGHTAGLYGLDFSPDGKLLATGGRDQTVRLWNVASGEQLAKLEGDGWVYGTRFSPVGGLLATARSDKKVRLWDIRPVTQDGKGPSSPVLRTTLEGHTDWVSGLDFDPEGRRLVTSGKDGIAIVWDTESGEEIRRLRGHDQWVNKVAFSHDGSMLATGGDDALAIVWDAKTGKPRLRLRASTGVTALAFTPDDRALAITDRNTIILYPLDFSYADRDPAALLEKSQQASGLRLDGFRLSVATGNRK